MKLLRMFTHRKTPSFLWPPPSPPDPPDGYEIRCANCDFAAFHWIGALEHRERTDHGNLTVHRTDEPPLITVARKAKAAIR